MTILILVTNIIWLKVRGKFMLSSKRWIWECPKSLLLRATGAAILTILLNSQLGIFFQRG
ncbi:hypothetical protein DVQ33_22290 [Yersinia enterocolitica]|nr:hypothetical protein [Yersinia enterocolitica]EKN6008226.1 hypothetical protein [Yersinia enterocolitica]EKN6081047.1 hypothetical protein [Yersinia enterocolitica]EKN6115128.1 hypothetical protein [Yersinia enterocolitica]EKN6119667.1 hypothetical protein [Yersinia enterocolitica]